MKESAVDIPPVGSAMAITLDTSEGRNADDLSQVSRGYTKHLHYTVCESL